VRKTPVFPPAHSEAPRRFKRRAASRRRKRSEHRMRCENESSGTARPDAIGLGG
jgi:hypothetical protein